MKERILQTAYMLYSKYGIKGVSMNQISRSLGISKATLYEEFGSKENLINACVEKSAEKVYAMILAIEEAAKSSMEALLMISNKVFHYYSSISPSFYKDLSHFLEANEKQASYKKKFYDRCLGYLQKGVEEGNYISSLDYEKTTALFIDQIGRLEVEYQIPMLVTFLRGICTPKGLEELNQILENTQLNQIIKV